MSIKKVYVKRIEEILTSGNTRPNIPPVGTNHIKDHNQWDDDMIYRGEFAINMDDGDVYTQDGKQPVVLGREDGIIEGLEIKTSGVSLREINVTNGKVRIKGRVYSYDPSIDTDDAIITIPENIESYPRLDAIGINGDLDVYDGSTKYYGTDFKVFKGQVRSDIPLPVVDEGYIFLGFVLVLPNQTAQDVLRPLPVSFVYNGDSPLDVSPAKFSKDLKTRVLKWYPNTLYLENTTIQHDNNLYRSAYTHVSDSSNLLADFNADKLVSLGAVTNSNISRFSHVGGSPTEGDFVSFFFTNWNGNTRILDAFQDISEWVNSFAPKKPNNISNSNVTIIDNVNKAGFTDKLYSNANVSDYVVTDNANVHFESQNKFTPYNSGALKSYLYTPATSYTTSNFDLTIKPTSLPNVVTLASDSNIYDLVILRDDHYDKQGYKGFYKSITANATTRSNLTPNVNSYRFNLTHLSSSANSEVEFYVESVRTPNIANVDNFTATSNAANLKYMSGVPILVEGDKVEFDYEVHDAVRYFYNWEKITSIESEIMANVKNINFGDTDEFDPSSLPPLSVPANSDADGEIIHLANVDCNITSNVIKSSVQFTISAYNALGDSMEYTTSGKAFLIDDVYDETNVRLYSNVGTFPGGSANVHWGNVYSDTQSQANIIGNRELQYFGGKYFYPKTDYTTYSGVKYSGNVVSYPNYDNGETGVFRWATFYLGDIQDEKYYNLEIRDTNGIEYDLSDGVTVSPNLKVYLKVWNSVDSSKGTGWVDINKAYISSNVANPKNDGDAALDLSWMEGNENYRRATFGTKERTGNVYVRIGTDVKDISFKDVVHTQGDPQEEDALWDYYYLGNIIGESYVVTEINGTDNSLMSDFLNGTTMTSNFDIQLRVFNDDDPNKGTDWLDANESYPANAFIPEDYDDPSLDLTYYDKGVPDATVRKITFGPTTRTGNVQVRVKLNGDQHYSNVTLLYPEDC